MKHIHEIQHQGLQWVNVTRQADKEMVEVKKRFPFAQADLDECMPPFQRPKIVKRDGYYFMVLHFPVFDRETRRLGFTEVDIFLTTNCLVTIHDNKLFTIDALFASCLKNEADRANYFSGTSVHIFFELLSRLLDAIFPILLHINEDINNIDKKLFAHVPGKEVAEEILRLKTNIVTFRRTMQAHKTVLERLVMYADRELNLVSFQSYINALREYNSEIWHMLESQKESINALHEANESILTLRTNDVMKTLTIISVLTFPMTLIATIFAIRAPGTPFVDSPYGFVAIVGLTATGVAAMLMVFKRKRWM